MLPIYQTTLPINQTTLLIKDNTASTTNSSSGLLHFEQEPIWTTTASDTESSVFFMKVMLLFLF